MPTLVRFLVVLIVLAAIGLAGMFYLANFVEPHTREMTVKVPADRLQRRTLHRRPRWRRAGCRTRGGAGSGCARGARSRHRLSRQNRRSR